MRIIEQYSDVLQNIEAAIVTVYEGHPDLVDRDVLAAIEALMRSYELQKRNREEFTLTPSGRARVVYEQCLRVCEWRLGRRSLDEGEPRSEDPKAGELSIAELLLCLKRLRKSVRVWHKQGGRQGYLVYVRQFIADADYQAHS